MDISEVRKKRNSYQKKFKEIDDKLATSLSEEDFFALEDEQNDLYKKILLCDTIIDSYNASDVEDFENLLETFVKGSVLR